MPFISAHVGDILVITLLVFIVLSILRYFYKRKKKGHSISCIGCSEADKCTRAHTCPSTQKSCSGCGENKNEV